MLRLILFATIPLLLPSLGQSQEQEGGRRPLGKTISSPIYAAQAEGENHPPEISSMRISLVSESSPRGGFRAQVEAKDPDGDPVEIRYQWLHNGEELPAEEEEVLEWREEFKKGDELTLEAVPFDGKVEGIWRAQGSITIPNSPPEITSPPEGRIEDGMFVYEVTAEDPDGDPIEYSLKDAPQGMSIDAATGYLSWNLIEHQPEGEVSFTVVASDNDGGSATQELKLEIPAQEETER